MLTPWPKIEFFAETGSKKPRPPAASGMQSDPRQC
jgi:hypothetical protein